MTSIESVDQLRSDPDPVIGLLDTALQYIANPQFFAYLLDFYRFVFTFLLQLASNFTPFEAVSACIY